MLRTIKQTMVNLEGHIEGSSNMIVLFEILYCVGLSLFKVIVMSPIMVNIYI